MISYSAGGTSPGCSCSRSSLEKCLTPESYTHVVLVRTSRASEIPPVRTAPVALPPLMPCFILVRSVTTLPLVWQCGQTIWGFLVFMIVSHLLCPHTPALGSKTH